MSSASPPHHPLKIQPQSGVGHRLAGTDWYGYLDGKLGDRRDTSILKVLPKAATDVRGLLYRHLDLQGVAVVDSLLGFYILRIGDALDPFVVARSLEETKQLEDIDFNAIGKTFGAPSDPYFESSQWNLGVDRMKMEWAWDITTGDTSIVALLRCVQAVCYDAMRT